MSPPPKDGPAVHPLLTSEWVVTAVTLFTAAVAVVMFTPVMVFTIRTVFTAFTTFTLLKEARERVGRVHGVTTVHVPGP